MRKLLAVALALTALSAHADTLADLRALLARCTGHSPIKATYTVQRSRKSEGRFVNDDFSGSVALELESNSNDFRLIFSNALLATIDAEQSTRRRDPKKDTPTLNALWEVTPYETSKALNFAPSLAEMLDEAKLVSDKPATIDGKAGRVLVLDLPPPKEANDVVEIGKAKIELDRLTLWLGEDGFPSLAEHVRNMKASALVFKAETHETQKWVFGHENDRLLRLRYETVTSGSGLGQRGMSTIIATLKPHD